MTRQSAPIIPLAQAKPGDLVHIGHHRGLARFLSTSPNGDIFLQPVGFPGPKHIITLNPSLPHTVHPAEPLASILDPVFSPLQEGD